jgi:hypothetical protein
MTLLFESGTATVFLKHLSQAVLNALKDSCGGDKEDS